MTDIFAAIQPGTDAATLLPATTSTSDAASGSDGQFESMITELITEAEETVSEAVSTLTQNEDVAELLTFTSSNSFVRSVIDILAGGSEPENAESDTQSASTEDADDSVIWPDDEQTEQTEDVNASDSRLSQAVNDVVTKVKDLISDKLKDAGLSDSDVEGIVEEYIYNRKELGEVISSLRDEVKQEAANIINEVADSLRNEDGSETQPVVKILDSLTQRIAPKTPTQADDTDDDSDDDLTDDTQDSELAAELAGLEGVALTSSQTQQTESTQDTQPDVTEDSPHRTQQTASTTQSRQVRTAQTESQTRTQEPQSTSEPQDSVQNFREVLENRTADNTETQDDDNQSQNQSQSFTQDRSDSNTRDSSTRSRTDTRRVDSRTTTTERTDSTTTTHRTESRTDFQSYFEGVLTSRRTASTSSPLPLSLRSTENFTQSSMLRDGLTNVVRFIRADGVQKARVIVDPPALGRISVELTSGTSGVEASIKVASEQIRQLVQDQLSELRMNLSQQGVQVTEFTVDVQQDNSGSQSQQGQDQSGQYANYFGSDDEDDTEEFRVDLEDGLLYWVA